MTYSNFIANKLARAVPTGIADAVVTSRCLFDFQRDIAQWALHRGRAAIFADTGLGKSRMQLTWADAVSKHTGKPVLILAPLAVAAQTADEGESIGAVVTICKEASDVRDGINIANYERLHKFEASIFGGVVLDESSIIKHHESKSFAQLCAVFADTAFKLCCTATPSPNDFTELGTHAQFLGICTQTEMLSEFFVHDGGETQNWRLKGHARSEFWKFVATWGVLVRSPADLGYDASKYNLPPLNMQTHVIEASAQAVKESGLLFAKPAESLMERRGARRASIADRVAKCAALVNADRDAWVVWCDLNAESSMLTEAIDSAIEVRGSMSTEEKEAALESFARGDSRVIVTKSSIAGFGLNWQHAHNMAFVGITDSYEAFYQSVRRCYRFGQQHPVNVHIFASELEGNVIANLERKAEDARKMADELSREASRAMREAIEGTKRKTNSYGATLRMIVPEWVCEEAA